MTKSAAALALAIALAACSSSRPPPPRNLPAAVTSTVVGPGDVFEVYVQGEKDLPKEYRVQPDGTIVFPYLDRVEVGGLEPQQIEERLRARFVERDILRHPQVTVVVKQYNSKKITIIGAVGKQGSIPFVEGMRLVEAISQAGGLSQLGDPNRVLLTRRIPGQDKPATAYISVDAITEGTQPDIPLQAGDTIKVEAKIW